MSDDRFKALGTDPRYRLPSRKEARTAVDPRFKGLFSDHDFRKKATVDKYGRKLKAGSQKKELEKLYRLDQEEPAKAQKKPVKFAEREVVGSSEEESEEEDVSDEALVEKRDPAREGGFSESSSEGSSSEEHSELDDEEELAEATAGQEQTEDIPMGEVSKRIACVNLDWDNIRAADIMAVAASFAPTDGSVEGVIVYPSEFGRERMEKEELEGPPREIFASSKRVAEDKDEDCEDDSQDEEEDGEEDAKIERQLQQQQVDDGNEFDTAALRQYQLERLRYYYAVITCSSDTCAKNIYDALDGHEYLNTSNFFDLRFIPDEVSFEDDNPKEECNEIPTEYTPNDFKTEALTHSKVRLTWDDDDPTRKEVQKRAFSRAEIDENDMKAYIGSDSSDAESFTSKKDAAEDRKRKKREAGRAKMRAALGLTEEPTKSKQKDAGEPVGDMQITFTSGLTSGKDKRGVFENEPQDKESTRERYIRKERERKQQRKERSKAKRGTDDADAADAGAEEVAEAQDSDQGFDDPFFNDPTAAAAAEKKAKKAEKARKKAAETAQDDEAAARRAELSLLMAEDKGDEVEHFDMRDITKAEKEARRKGKGKKGKKAKGAGVEAAAKDAFEVETTDPRFKALFESHEFAIDPTNARFKKTKGMDKLLEEGRRKRGIEDDDGQEAAERPKKSKKGGRDQDVRGLVTRLGGGKGAKS